MSERDAHLIGLTLIAMAGLALLYASRLPAPVATVVTATPVPDDDDPGRRPAEMPVPVTRARTATRRYGFPPSVTPFLPTGLSFKRRYEKA